MSADKLLGVPAAASLRPIAFGPRRAVLGLGLSLLAYCSFVAFAFIFSRLNISDSASLAVMHAGGAIGLLTFWRLGRWGRGRFDCFGAVLMLVGAAFRLHAMVDAIIYGIRVEDIYAYRSVPMPENVLGLYLKAEFMTVLALLLVACSWRLTVGERIERFSFRVNLHEVPLKISMLIYLSAVGVDLARRIVGVEFGALSQFMALLFVFGVASIYFVAAKGRTAFRRVAVALAMALPMTFLALNSGMKEEMFFPLIPAVFLFWNGYRSALPRLSLLMAALAVMSVAQLYVHHVRDTTWRSDGDLAVSPVELVEGFSADFGTMQASDAFDAISSRINMTTAHAITVTLADHNGFEPGNVFGMIPASLIPRLFWPGKPIMQPGAMHTARIWGIDVPLSEIRSSTAAGFAAELYLGGWWLGVVFGASLYGFLLASAQRWALLRVPGFGQLALCFVSLYWTLRFDEKAVVYAYTSIIFSVAFLWLLSRALGPLGFRSSRKEVRWS